MKLKMRISTNDFRAALKTYQKATNKDMAEVLNRAGRNVAFKAISFTPMSRLAKHRTYEPDGSGTHRSRLFHALATKGTRLGRAKKGQGNQQLAERLYNHRLKSRGYIKAGWIEAAKDFGGRPRARTWPGGRAAKGYGRKASTLRLEAWLFNFSDGAETVGKVPLNRAMAFVAKDMLNYAYKRMRRTAKRYSGR